MSRSYRRPHQLAKVLGCTPEEALAKIRTLGVPLATVNELIPRSQTTRILEALGAKEKLRQGEPRPETANSKQEQISKDSEEAKSGAGSEAVEPEAAAKSKAPPIPPKRDLIGHRKADMSYLTAEEVKRIHYILVEDFAKTRDPIDPPGVRDDNLLRSAVFRVHTSLGAELKYPTVPMAAAAYLHSIIQNHVFHNGNKRTALVTTLVFMDLNGQLLEVDQDELFDYIMAVASHAIVDSGDDRADRELNEIAQWLHSGSRPLSKQERRLKFHELRSILSEYGCEFEQPKRGNRINIFRGDRRTQVHYRNEGTDVPRNMIHKVRRDLGLTEQEGYDSTIFYASEAKIPDFIHRYRRTLDRLAKV